MRQRPIRTVTPDALGMRSSHPPANSSRQFELVVSDIGMPGRDGFSLMRELRMDYGLRGVAISGFVRAPDREAAREVRFERFLPKPLEIPELLAAVRELTGEAAAGGADQAGTSRTAT